jgi:hypothetical protein
MAKIDAGGRHSGGGGARVVRSGEGSRCPGTEDVWVSSHVKEKKGERERGANHRRRGACAAGNGATAGSLRRRHVCEEGRCRDAQARERVRKDSCSCFISQEKGRGAIAKAEIAKGGHGGRP